MSATVTTALHERANHIAAMWRQEVDKTAQALKLALRGKNRHQPVTHTPSDSTVRAIELNGQEEEGMGYTNAGDEFAKDLESALRQSLSHDVRVEFQPTCLGFGRGRFVATKL